MNLFSQPIRQELVEAQEQDALSSDRFPPCCFEREDRLSSSRGTFEDDVLINVHRIKCAELLLSVVVKFLSATLLG